MLLEVSGGVLGGFIGASMRGAIGDLERGCSSMFLTNARSPNQPCYGPDSMCVF